MPPKKEPTINLEDVVLEQPVIASQSISYTYVQNETPTKESIEITDAPVKVTYVYSL